MNPLYVIIVSYGHDRVIEATLRSLCEQEPAPYKIIVVDCTEQQGSWLDRWQSHPRTQIIRPRQNLGFTGGNNLAWKDVREQDGYVLFLNPDVILPPGLFRALSQRMQGADASQFAALSVRLHRWDFETQDAVPGVDSTGIFPTFSGWMDRRSGSPPERDVLETVPALCGAFFLAPISLLRSAELSPGVLWDSRYFAYKEDIELSLRLRRGGHRLAMWHGAHVYHGRGWSRRRRDVPRAARLLSARNEVRLDLGYRPQHLPVSLAKWGLVRMFDL